MTQIEQLITEHLAIWTSADTEKKSGRGRASSSAGSVYGIKKLRELILELAVRGKLVPQDANDEPASELLKRIQGEKAKLIADGKIKKEKAPLQIDEIEKTFELPNHWSWVRLSNIIDYVNGFAFSSSDFSNEGVGVVKIGDIQLGCLTPESMSRVAFDVVSDLDERLKVEPNDLVIAMSGATTGKLGFNNTDQTFYLNQRVGKIVPFVVSKKFLFLDLTTKIAANLAKSFGSAIPNLSTEQINAIVIALPPLAEQHRIVAKVDELMALCDQLEAQHSNAQDAHEQLVSHLLGTLTQTQTTVRPEPVEGQSKAAENVQYSSTSPSTSSGRTAQSSGRMHPDQSEFEENWQRIATHFDILFTTESSIEALKQTILQLAVMGKLVPQDPNDEPASELLKRIQAEKAKLVVEGKIKKDKLSIKANTDGEPFALPLNWAWIKLDELMPQFQNGASSRGDVDGVPVIVLRLADIIDRRISIEDPRELSISKSAIDKYLLAQGDLLIVRVNGSADLVGGFIVCEENFNGIYCDHFIRMRIPSQFIDPQFLGLVGATGLVRDRIKDLFITTAGQKTVNQGHIGSLPIPLLSVSEQRRIVSSVNELIRLCDQLKYRITDANKIQKNVANALVEGALL